MLFLMCWSIFFFLNTLYTYLFVAFFGFATLYFAQTKSRYPVNVANILWFFLIPLGLNAPQNYLYFKVVCVNSLIVLRENKL